MQLKLELLHNELSTVTRLRVADAHGQTDRLGAPALADVVGFVVSG